MYTTAPPCLGTFHDVDPCILAFGLGRGFQERRPRYVLVSARADSRLEPHLNRELVAQSFLMRALLLNTLWMKSAQHSKQEAHKMLRSNPPSFQLRVKSC